MTATIFSPATGKVEIIDIGQDVLCDFCNGDYTDDETGGGLLLGTYAICPDCAEAHLVKYGDKDIDDRCPDGMSFRDWVLTLRGGNNLIAISDWVDLT